MDLDMTEHQLAFVRGVCAGLVLRMAIDALTLYLPIWR